MALASFEARLTRLEALVQVLAGTTRVPDAAALMEQAGMRPDAWQGLVLRSGSERLLLNCCRQSGKTAVAAALALATALQEPGALVLVLSPSLRQSQESFRQVLTLYRSLHATVPPQAESALRLELANGARIVSLPGTESTVRGYSQVRLLVIDEASRVADELYHSVRPMLAVSQGRLLALSTPWGKRGWFYEAWESAEAWERVKITAHDCPRISPQFLAEEERTMPRPWFESEYLCRFTEGTNSLFFDEDIQAAFAYQIPELIPGGF